MTQPKQILAIFIFFIFLQFDISLSNLNFADNGKDKMNRKVVIEKALNYSRLLKHIKSNPIIDTKEIIYIKDDQRINDLQLTFENRLLKFNDGKGEEKFFHGWTFEIEKLDIRRKTAKISYRFIPRWFNCSDTIQMTGAARLFIDVRIEFNKIGEEWEIINAELKDIEFDNDDPKCLLENYKRL